MDLCNHIIKARFVEVWLAVTIIIAAQVAANPSVTITTSPELGATAYVCRHNDSVVLTCHTDQPRAEIMWYWLSESKQGNALTVPAMQREVVYNCVATIGGWSIVEANVTVSANGTAPIIRRYNFANYVQQFEGSSINLTTITTTDLPLSNGTPVWNVSDSHSLPTNAVVENYNTTDGKLYSTLLLSNLSFADSSGNYTCTACNECGCSFVFVYIEVDRAPAWCNNTGKVAIPTPDVVTVVDEYVEFRNQFIGNLPALGTALTTYCTISFPPDQQKEDITIFDNSTDPYRIAVYPACLMTPVTACCNFTIQLTVLNVSLSLDGAKITCTARIEIVGEDPLIHSSSANLTVYDFPKMLQRPSDVCASVYTNKSLHCLFEAPVWATVVVWSKDGIEIKDNVHYEIVSVHGINNEAASVLNIRTITSKDNGNYTCYCYYNRSLISSQKVIKSVERSGTLRTDCVTQQKKDRTSIFAVGGVVVFVLVSSLFVGCLVAVVVVRKWKRKQTRRGYISIDDIACAPGTQESAANRSNVEPHRVDDSAPVGSGTEESTVISPPVPIRELSGDSIDAVPAVQEVSSGDCIVSRSPGITPCAVLADGSNNVQEPVDSTDDGQLITIFTHPKSQTVRLNTAKKLVTLCCQAEAPGGQQLVYKWYYLRGSEKAKTFKTEEKTVRCKESCFDVCVNLKRPKRQYCCEVSLADHSDCWVRSNVAIITAEPVWFVEQPKEKYVAVTGHGSEVTLSCEAQAAPGVNVNYCWYKCEADCLGRQPIQCYEKIMVLPAIGTSQGNYICDVSIPQSGFERISSRVSYVEVVNSTDITIEVHPPQDRYVEIGDKLQLKCRATCKHYLVHYQWYHNGAVLIGATNATLTRSQVSEDHLGPYHCEVSSEYSANTAISEICRVHWKEHNTCQTTENIQQVKAEEVLKLDDKIYATDKMALLIGNSDYKGKPLKCSKNDVEALTNKLRQLNFKTISLVDLTLSQTVKAVDFFCHLLDEKMYAVFYYSGHGVAYHNTTYLMPIDADQSTKIDECVNSDVIKTKLQRTKSKVIMIFDCCRTSIEEQASVPLSSMQSIANHSQSEGFSNVFQVFACAPSLESYEGKHCSFMTQALLKVVDKSVSVFDVFRLTEERYNRLNLPVSGGKPSPRLQKVLQMKAVTEISFCDPILNPQMSRCEELLLVLPKKCNLEFAHPKLKRTYRQIELTFRAIFSNVIIVDVTCDAALQPEVNAVGPLTAELACACDVQRKPDNITSFRISNLLEAVQGKTKLQISFQMPEDSSAKETLEYELPSELIKPTFYRH